MGEKLRDTGVLEQTADVFYLRLEELHQITDGRENDWREVAKRRQVERAVVEDCTQKVLQGTPASAGIAEGRAKVLLTASEADKIQPGEILVCRTTSPAWSHLFSRVGGVVADAGGVLSHCAIVAREYAIPCVVGVGGATEQIQDGMMITVDGGQGTVRIQSDA